MCPFEKSRNMLYRDARLSVCKPSSALKINPKKPKRTVRAHFLRGQFIYTIALALYNSTDPPGKL